MSIWANKHVSVTIKADNFPLKKRLLVRRKKSFEVQMCDLSGEHGKMEDFSQEYMRREKGRNGQLPCMYGIMPVLF